MKIGNIESGGKSVVECVNPLKIKVLINYYLDRLVGLGVCMSNHEVAGLILGTSTNFKCRLGLERGPPSLVRIIA